MEDVMTFKQVDEKLASEILPEVPRLKKLSERRDPETGEFSYKQKFRDEMNSIVSKIEVFQSAVEDLRAEMNEIEARERNQEERKILKLREKQAEDAAEKERMKREKLERESEERRKLDAEREHEAEVRRLERETQLLMMQEKANRLDIVFRHHQTRIEAFKTTFSSETEKEKEIDACMRLLASVKTQHGGKVAKQLITLLIMFFENITKRPEKEEFRRFNLEKEKFKKDVLRHPGTLELFHVSGFDLMLNEAFDEENSLQRTILLTMEEPEITKFEEWKQWFDTLKLVVVKLQKVKGEL